MDDFLAKPIHAAGLWAAIERVLAAFPLAHRSGKGLLNPRVLLAACGGDADILRGICEGLRASLPSHLVAIRDGFESQDAHRLREAAHKLSGMMAAFSTVAGGMASDLEDYSARGQLEAAEPLVQKIEAVGQELIQLVAHDLTIESLRHEAGIAEH